MRPKTSMSTWMGCAVGACALISSVAIAGESMEERVLFDFTSDAEQQHWKAVNDGVMGGRSLGAPVVQSRAGVLDFSGTLSLENNGGFSSIRSAGPSLNLDRYDGISMRFRGDGRSYIVTIATDYRIRAGSYETALSTVAGEWTTVRLPFEQFTATSYGRPVRGAPVLDNSNIRSVGVMLADKRAGSFHLQIDRIAAYRDANKPRKDIVATAVDAGSFRTLAAALQAAGLIEALQGRGPFTVFAPTDAAFAKLPSGTVERLLKPENRDALIAILTYHVVPGRVTSDRVIALSNAQTLSGKTVDIRVDDGAVRVGGATVTQVDVAARNGVIHVIDTVLMPPAAVETVTDSPSVHARRLIETAIHRGVPMYNNGNSSACAAIYEVAVQGLLAMSSKLPDRDYWRGVETRLASIQNERDADRQAWALRHVLDDAYRVLARP